MIPAGSATSGLFFCRIIPIGKVATNGFRTRAPRTQLRLLEFPSWLRRGGASSGGRWTASGPIRAVQAAVQQAAHLGVLSRFSGSLFFHVFFSEF